MHEFHGKVVAHIPDHFAAFSAQGGDLVVSEGVGVVHSSNAGPG
jgi:hypothetical protein